MAARRRDRSKAGRNDEAVEASFHAPFRDLARQARDLARKARFAPDVPAPPSSTAASSTVASSVVVASSASPSTPALPAATTSVQDCAAADFRAGVEPLPRVRARVLARPRVDLSRIAEARREEADALRRAEGFDVTYDDLYVRGRARGVSRETLAGLEKGAFRICAHLDLHGMPLDDARRAVDEFLAEQQKKGRRCVLIVTGKGKNSPRGHGVLREHVPQWLARGPSSRRVLAFASARACDGGVGALVVLMRGYSSSKNRIDVEHGGAGPIEA